MIDQSWKNSSNNLIFFISMCWNRNIVWFYVMYFILVVILCSLSRTHSFCFLLEHVYMIVQSSIFIWVILIFIQIFLFFILIFIWKIIIINFCPLWWFTFICWRLVLLFKYALEWSFGKNWGFIYRWYLLWKKLIFCV